MLQVAKVGPRCDHILTSKHPLPARPYYPSLGTSIEAAHQTEELIVTQRTFTLRNITEKYKATNDPVSIGARLDRIAIKSC